MIDLDPPRDFSQSEIQTYEKLLHNLVLPEVLPEVLCLFALFLNQPWRLWPQKEDLREQSRAGGRGAVIIYLCVEVMILTQQSEMST